MILYGHHTCGKASRHLSHLTAALPVAGRFTRYILYILTVKYKARNEILIADDLSPSQAAIPANSIGLGCRSRHCIVRPCQFRESTGRNKSGYNIGNTAGRSPNSMERQRAAQAPANTLVIQGRAEYMENGLILKVGAGGGGVLNLHLKFH